MTIATWFFSISGKNDGTVQGIKYFTCKPKHGMFVRADKLILDRRGRTMRAYKADALAASTKLVQNRGKLLINPDTNTWKNMPIKK